MKLKANLEPIASSDFWYDLIYGGYIEPGRILESETDETDVLDAIEILIKFKQTLEDSDLLEEM